MSPIERKARGVQAEALLKDDLLIEALREVRFAAHRAFESAHGDREKLDRASRLLDAAADFQRFLMLAVKHGAAAAKEIDRDQQAGRFVRGIGRLVRSRDPIADEMPWRDAG